jgi:hypothetical protein
MGGPGRPRKAQLSAATLTLRQGASGKKRGRPRLNDDETSPQRLQKRLSMRQKREEGDASTSCPTPAQAERSQSTPPSTRSKRCCICLYAKDDSGHEAMYIPCCSIRIHRRCLQTQMHQDPACGMNGRVLMGPTSDPSRNKPIPLKNTHACPGCRKPIDTSRSLTAVPPHRSELRAPGLFNV